mgnify:CR=1 FL=1
MSEITTQDVQKLAELSRLEYSEAATEEIRAELGNILGFISKLSEVDTENIVPTTSVLGLAEGKTMQTPERADKITEMLENPQTQRDAFQTQAPEADMGFYVVPQVIE